LSGLKTSLNYPLLFEPGERWDYGIGIDWLGRAVEKIDGRSIDRFCIEEIFEPLRMPDTRFEVEPHMASRLASVSLRGEDGRFADYALAPPSNPEFYGMGHSLYSTAPDYMRFLRMYLNKGTLDGKRVLVRPGCSGCYRTRSATTFRVEDGAAITADAGVLPRLASQQSMGFMRFGEDIPGSACGVAGLAGVLPRISGSTPRPTWRPWLIVRRPFVEPLRIDVRELERGLSPRARMS
jgi:hypothetical protein